MHEVESNGIHERVENIWHARLNFSTIRTFENERKTRPKKNQMSQIENRIFRTRKKGRAQKKQILYRIRTIKLPIKKPRPP